MKKHTKSICFILLIIFFIFPVSTNLMSQDLTSESAKNETFEEYKLAQLKRLRNDLVSLRSQIQSINNKLSVNPDLVTKIKLENDLAQKETEFNKKSFLFIELATNINLRVDTEKPAKTDFSQDLKEILAPVIESIKEISLKPRQIQKLNDTIQQNQKRYDDSLKALKKLEDLYKKNVNKELKWTLKRSIGKVKSLSEKLKISLEESSFKKLKMEKNEESLVTTFSYLILNFFKTKGKNLFLALMIGFFVYWLFALGKSKIVSFLLNRIHRSANSENYLWVIRPVKVLYSFGTFMMALFFGILTLYSLNDWVLVTFIIFVIVALIWSSKQYFPVFFEQTKIVLNLGSVREGERVIYQDLPWKIKNLGYYCRLENPSLSGGTLRISSKELVNLNSRPINKTEPWFPTKTNDWVDVDGVYGKITMQSPEQVILKLVSSEHKYFKTTDFYNSKPVNLSQGFSINFFFGLDYNLQSKMFDEVIPNIRKEIKQSFDTMFSQSKDSFHELSVDFANANSSSLDLRIFIKCDGVLAPKRDWLKRNFQEVIVLACNKYNYNIPFNHVSIHHINTP